MKPCARCHCTEEFPEDSRYCNPCCQVVVAMLEVVLGAYVASWEPPVIVADMRRRRRRRKETCDADMRIGPPYPNEPKLTPPVSYEEFCAAHEKAIRSRPAQSKSKATVAPVKLPEPLSKVDGWEVGAQFESVEYIGEILELRGVYARCRVTGKRTQQESFESVRYSAMSRR